jgi:predicted metal-dependent peptidase
MLVDANVENVRFMQADTHVTDEQTFTRESMPLKVTMQGRGGTRFGPAIAEMAEKYPSVSCLIYLTDLESSDFGSEPHFPVVWITNSATEAPYGEIIEVN